MAVGTDRRGSAVRALARKARARKAHQSPFAPPTDVATCYCNDMLCDIYPDFGRSNVEDMSC